MRALALLALLSASNATELTPENFDKATEGKTVFIKFLAPWCGHCKSMKPDWDKVMKAYKDSETVLVADVDCTAEGKALCTDIGVKSYPTLKYGDPHNLADYTGARDFQALKDFADTLGPTCSPGKLYLCDEEKTEKIEKFMAMSSSELEAAMNEKYAEIEKIEADFKLSNEPKTQEWQKKKKEKDEAVEEIKAEGFAFMKAVQVQRKWGKKTGFSTASKLEL